MIIKKAIILHASIGSGHTVAAEAISDCLKSYGIKTKVMDILSYSEIKIPSSTKSVNFRGEILGPIYDFLWRQDLLANITKKSIELVNNNFNRLHKSITRYSADVIITTHVMGAISTLGLIKKIPIFAVVTDFRVSPIWSRSDVDHFFVANLISKVDLLNKGIESKKVTISGIPIRKGFTSKIVVKHSSRYKILVMAGGLNGATNKVSDTQFIESLISLSKNFEVTVVLGSNHSLKRKFDKYPNHELTLIGLTKDVSSIMTKSDLVIAKPGGLICAEATALGKPVLFINEGYGQEKGNADYLINNEAAILAKGFDHIENLVNIIFDGNNLNRMSENSKRIGKRNASETILNKVIKLINT